MFFFRDQGDVVQGLRDAIRQRRVEMRLRQVDLAEKSGVPLATINLFERSGKISLESFARLLIALDLDRPLLEALRKASSSEPATMKEFLAAKPKRRVHLARRQGEPPEDNRTT